MDHNFNVRQARSVGDVLGDTFTYIRVYYKSLAKMIAVYVLAPLMVGSIVISSSMGELMTEFTAGLQDQPDPNLFSTGLEFFAGFFFLMISYFLLMGVVYQHIYYAGKGEVPESISDFSDGMFSKLLRLIPALLIVAALFFFVVLLGGFAAIEISGFLVLFFIPLGVYLMIKLVLFPIAFFVEDAGGFNSLVRSWELTNGYFWSTFGVYLLITIVFGILSQLLSTPLFVVTAIAGAGLGTESGIMEIIVVFTYTLSFVFQVLFFAAQSIALGLHYFNLEERKEGQTLGEQVAGLENETA
ncbi:hypothetical protein [Rhodohalobacter sp. 8-1]|uniref:hypothetical protein n=1 Tax=Rhodohalobacter sp. 8-1 TaxID=3131972 RepID=UPI0030EB5266